MGYNQLEEIVAGGIVCLNNGLSEEENNLLLQSTDVIEIVGLIIKGLKNVFIHSPYDDLETYFVKLNKYTTLAAQTNYETLRQRQSAALRYPALYTLGHLLCSLPSGFIKRYLLKAGFLDGMRGFIWAVCSVIYTFVKYIKLWYLLQK